MSKIFVNSASGNPTAEAPIIPIADLISALTTTEYLIPSDQRKAAAERTMDAAQFLTNLHLAGKSKSCFIFILSLNFVVSMHNGNGNNCVCVCVCVCVCHCLSLFV